MVQQGKNNMNKGTEKLYQVTNPRLSDDYEPDFFDGDDSAFGGSIGDDLQYINVQKSPMPFFDWLNRFTSQQKGKGFYDWLGVT